MKNDRPIKLVFTLAFLLMLASGYNCLARGQILTLDKVLDIALKRNPFIAESLEDVEASQARVTQAESDYLPQISSQAGYQRQRQWSANTGQIPGLDGTHNEYNSYDAGILVSQYIYDFGKTSGKVEQSLQDLEASQKGLGKTSADVIRDVKKAYFEVLKKIEMVNVSEESLRTQEKHLEQARAMHKAGIRPKIDVTKGLVELSKTKLQLITCTYAVRTAKVDLENVLGGPPVKGEYTLAEVPSPAIIIITDPSPLFREGLENRPEMAILQDQTQSSQAELKVAQAGYRPSISAGASYGWGNIEFPLEDSWEIGASLNWEIFSGYRTRGEVREAKANLAKLKAQLRQLKLQVIQEVSHAFIAVNESAEMIRTARMALREAEENMELAEGRYRTGVSDAIEYSDAQLMLTEARSDLVQATYEHLEDLADLDHAAGRGYRK